MTRAGRPRVWVTGVGAISAAGIGMPALSSALASGRCCIGPVKDLALPGVEGALAAEVDLLPRLPRAWVRRATRSDLLALAALSEALRSSGLEQTNFDPTRIGVAVGSSTGGLREIENWYEAERSRSLSRRESFLLWSASVASPVARVAFALGAQGPRSAPSTACSSGAVAIATALDWIRSGRVDLAIAGGTDALCRITWTGFHALRSLAPEPCRPFDLHRRGLSLGEGAALLVLESEAHARARGAVALAELAGAGLSCDAHHTTAPQPEGLGAAAAILNALRDAETTPDEIGYVNAHGTGTPQNDAAEASALARIFGEDGPPVSSTKGIIGHLLGAAGAIEAAIAVSALVNGRLPATLGLEEPDPACVIRHVKRGGEIAAPRAVISNSFGFGGSNCSIVLRAP